MSMDAGGLAQMSYNNSNSLPLPGNSFGSRGKASHISRLSLNPPTIPEDEADNAPAPRTSRSHLLAGLRTARKDSGSAAPVSAPYTQTQFAEHVQNPREFIPQTARAPTFSAAGQFQANSNNSNSQQVYSRPDQVLPPPSLNFGTNETSGMDPQVYQNLMATNQFLAQRQQQLQQQLMNVQAAAQQFGNMGLNQQSPMSPIAQNGFYGQQLQNGMQPIVQPVPNAPGIYQVYNPMTGQTSFYPEPALQQANLPQSPSMAGFHNAQDSGDMSGMRRNNSSPKTGNGSGAWSRHFSPPRQSPSPPQDVAPLPEPSANAYRPGHRKSMSSANRLAAVSDQAKNGIRSPGFPQTPIDGTFGLGLGRAGEHPVRQPRGPPALDELLASPTSKVEGSKNFATRQRRRALFSLVRAGNDRRAGRPGSANGEGASSSSENESPNPLVSDADSETTGNSLSATSSMGSLKATAGGANGSGAKTLKADGAPDTFARRLTGSSHPSDEETSSGERKRTPMLVLTSAEKRRSPASAIVN